MVSQCGRVAFTAHTLGTIKARANIQHIMVYGYLAGRYAPMDPDERALGYIREEDNPDLLLDLHDDDVL